MIINDNHLSCADIHIALYTMLQCYSIYHHVLEIQVVYQYHLGCAIILPLLVKVWTHLPFVTLNFYLTISDLAQWLPPLFHHTDSTSAVRLIPLLSAQDHHHDSGRVWDWPHPLQHTISSGVSCLNLPVVGDFHYHNANPTTKYAGKTLYPKAWLQK